MRNRPSTPIVLLLSLIVALILLFVGLSQPSPLSLTGTLASVDAGAGRIIIDRDPGPGGGPVTRIAYSYVGRRDLSEIQARSRVGFSARESDGGDAIGAVWPLPQSRTAAPAAADSEQQFGHHHNPHHGGFVGMVGDYHVEAVAARDGVVRAYLSDISRRPLPLRGFFGKAILHDGDNAITRALGRMSTNTGPALGTRFDEFEVDEVVIEFDLVRGEETINVEFLLPLERAVRKKPQMPKRCEPMQNKAYYAISKPWCSMDFGRAIAALALSAGGHYVGVGSVDLPVSTWSLPDGKRRAQFKPAPDVPPAPGHHEHADAPNALVAVPPDGAEAVVVLENRFLRYESGSGRLLGELSAADGLVLDAQRPSEKGPMVAQISYRKDLVQIADDDSAPRRFAAMDAMIVAFAVSSDGARVAVADDAGVVRVFDSAGLQLAEMSTRLARISSLAFAGDYLAGTSKDGFVRAWHATSGGQVGERGMLPPQLRVVADPSGRRLVVGGAKGALRLFTVPALRPGLQMDYHKAAITGLAWSGESIVSGDESGVLAVWRFSAPSD